MHTNTAQQIAEVRHQIMLDFLKHFHEDIGLELERFQQDKTQPKEVIQ